MHQIADTPVSAHPEAALSLDQWLVARRNAGATPPVIARELVADGWSFDAASGAALRSLRDEDRQELLWFALCWSAGLTAVGTTTAVHQLLATEPDRHWAALSLTVAIVMAPIAGVCGWLARRSEQRSTFTVWSPSRRSWFGTLATCTAFVGLVRLIGYLYSVVSSLVGGEHAAPLDGRALAQVLVSLAVAVPLFVWSFHQWRRSNVAISGLMTEAA